MARLAITKCQGTGNDFVLLDDRAKGGRYAYAALATALCDRRFGVGADGLLVLAPASAPGADVAMRIFNADGSEAEMCGNGIRCVARYLHERGAGAPRRLGVETSSGIMRTDVVAGAEGFRVRVEMNVPEKIVVHAEDGSVDVVMGNPHCVAFVDTDPDDVDLRSVAARIASAERFSDGVNVEVARASRGSIAMRVYERGVGETSACGTGACAVAAAAIVTGRATTPVRIAMRGGDVDVDWAGPGRPAYLTGGAEIVFDAEVPLPDAIAAPVAPVM
jgi:diaminopimelate epimerase